MEPDVCLGAGKSALKRSETKLGRPREVGPKKLPLLLGALFDCGYHFRQYLP